MLTHCKTLGCGQWAKSGSKYCEDCYEENMAKWDLSKLDEKPEQKAKPQFKVGDRVRAKDPDVLIGKGYGTICNPFGVRFEEYRYYESPSDYHDIYAWELELIGPKTGYIKTTDNVNHPSKKITSDGGPSEYYDFPPKAMTLNDLIEHKGMDFHRGNIFKACWRFGTKSGTSKEYDARKIIYSGARILMQLAGVKQLRKTLEEMLDDPQFQERD